MRKRERNRKDHGEHKGSWVCVCVCVPCVCVHIRDEGEIRAAGSVLLFGIGGKDK